MSKLTLKLLKIRLSQLDLSTLSYLNNLVRFSLNNQIQKHLTLY